MGRITGHSPDPEEIDWKYPETDNEESQEEFTVNRTRAPQAAASSSEEVSCSWNQPIRGGLLGAPGSF
jgi:hypothetical protein